MPKKKPDTLSFGSLTFRHKPLTMLALITIFDDETLLKDALQAFADFANANGLTDEEIGWRDMAAQGSLPDFHAFLREWQSFGGPGNA